MLGNSHARFLGEWWSATAATYPINIAFIFPILCTDAFPMGYFAADQFDTYERIAGILAQWKPVITAPGVWTA